MKTLCEIEKLDKSETLEDKTEPENMNFGSVFKSMLPSVLVGTLSAMGCQEACSEYTSNPELITLSGMAGQYVGGWGSYLPIHYFNNQERLKDKKGKVKWRQYFQDIGSVIASDQVGNKVWAGAYGLSNEISLRKGLDASTSGLISGLSSGLIYTTFTAFAAPKVNAVINYIKKKLKWENPEDLEK